MAFSEAFSNKKIAKLLHLIAAVYQLKGENRFKSVAYQKAADSVEQLSRELYTIWEEGTLADIPGFGGSIGKSIDELFRTGESKHFSAVLAGVPATLPVLMDVPGIGPKKAIRLIHEFKLFDEKTVLDDIVSLAKAGRIEKLEGFGKKSQQDLVESIELFRSGSIRKQRMPLPVARAIYDQIAAYLSTLACIRRIDPMGSLRRQLATIGDVDIAVVAPDDKAEEVIAHFLQSPGMLAVDNAGDKKASIIYPPNVRVDLRVTDGAQYGSMLQYFTGSKQHNIALREFALKKGYSLNEYGIKDISTKKLHKFSSEEEFYRFLGLAWIPPEIREGTTEIDLAQQNKLPSLVAETDIRGDFHIHSSYNISTSHDLGQHTYEEIVEKAVALGYSYIGFADHNPRMSGHTDADIISILQKRKAHIDTVLKGSPIPYYIGLEVDILGDGSLAIPEEAGEFLDYIIASIHSGFALDRAAQTARITRAFSHRKVRVLGHPTGRLINKREGIHADWNAIIAEAVERNVALEINSHPLRLDLPEMLVREAMTRGASFMVNTDAHDITHMDFMRYGVSVARRGWLEPKHIINTRSPEAFRNWLLSS
ncbi:MAG: DNA polymerase/3'-5' exonuclease PolX [Patescibacteria group bacterium]|nr:DNA polymerase/3'-5' exonuclease PolX [Patescibacteria group bacterium]